MNDIDKVYDLLARLYSEVREGRKETNQRFQKVDQRFQKVDQHFQKVDQHFQEVNQHFQEVNQRLDSLEAGQNKLDNRISKIETFLEHDIKEKLQALHEREGANSDRLEEHSQRLAAIEKKMDIVVMSVNSQDKRLELVESKHKKAK